ncbi:hypothetical protein [Trichormus variabilis]|uniref:Transposase n=1 Tax=Trichormus variabilis N2B TaxID=2681315 RepID=A0ABR6SIB7_ANAVA|nr:hypothetical protein [Trichormus variabilis]MBC1306054.1 hypothetical protein [Trichormus variabilis N2B]MBC1330303.1 hypothetical protein [Trichormus variabilis 9RC]
MRDGKLKIKLELVLSRDVCNFEQDGLETPTIYTFQQFSSEIDILVQILGIYSYKNRSIY